MFTGGGSGQFILFNYPASRKCCRIVDFVQRIDFGCPSDIDMAFSRHKALGAYPEAFTIQRMISQSARSGCHLLIVVRFPPAIIILKDSLRSATPFQGRKGGFAARVARLATPTNSKVFGVQSPMGYPPIHPSLLLITYAHTSGRCRAGQEAIILVQSMKRHWQALLPLKIQLYR